MYKHEDSLGVQIINNQTYLKDVTLYAREEIDNYTFDVLKELLGKGQVVELDRKKVVLSLAKIEDIYDFNLSLRFPFYVLGGGSQEYTALFRVFILDNGQYLLNARYERHFNFKIIDNEEEIKKRYEAFASKVMEKQLVRFTRDLGCNFDKLLFEQFQIEEFMF